MMMLKGFLESMLMLSGVALVLSGCSGVGTYEARRDQPVSPGYVLAIAQPIDIPSGKRRVYVQDGRVTRFQDRNRFEPVCSLRVRALGSDAIPTRIPTGRLEIVSVRTGAQAAVEPLTRVQLASRTPTRLATKRRRGGGVGYLTYYWEARLRSGSVDGVDQLRCEVDRDPNWPGRLGVESAQRAFGELAQLTRPET